MSQSHTGSILPQKGGVVPIDNLCAFYAPFDEDANDAIRGVKHVGEKNALEFDGTSTYVDIGNVCDIGISDFNISAWVKTTTASTLAIVSKTLAGPQLHRYALRVQSGKLALMVAWGDATTHVDYIGQATINDGKWHHVSASLIRTQTISLYVDGKLDRVFDISTRDNRSNFISNNPLRIGAYTASNNVDISTFFAGTIGSVQIYKRALAEDEINKIMNSEIDAIDSGLIGSWKLNESEGRIACDYSSHGNDGVIIGGIWANGMAQYQLVKQGYPGGTIRAQEETENLFNGIKTTNGNEITLSTNGEWEVLTSIVNGASMGRRHYVDLTKLVNGDVYTSSATVYNPGETAVRVYQDWCDQGGFSTVIEPKETRRIHLSALRSTYTDVFRFYDIDVVENGGVIWVKDVQIEHKPYPTEYIGGPGSKRSGRQEYGGGVLIEEGTTNQIRNGNVKDLTYWGLGVDTGAGDSIIRRLIEDDGVFNKTCVEFDVITRNSWSYFTHHLSQYIPAGWFKVGTTYTLSFWAKKIRGNNLLSISIRNGNGLHIVSPTFSFNATGEWQKYTMSFNALVTGEAPVVFMSMGTGNTIRIDGMQLEENPFPTSFVDGTRETSYLTYVFNQVQSNNFTLNFWAKLNDLSTLQPLYVNMSQGNYISTNRFYLRPQNNETINGGFVISGAIYDVGNTVMSKEMISDWTMYTFVSSDSSWSIYLNGELKKERAAITVPFSLDRLSFLENASKGSVALDEVRIDKVARTPEEIMSWYYQGRNGW